MWKRVRATFGEYGALPRPVWALAGARFVNAVGAYVYPFLTLILTDRLAFSKEEAGRVLLMASFLFVPGSLLGGLLADRLGRKRLLVAAQVMAALSIGVIGFVPLDGSIVWFILAEHFFSGLMMPAASAATYDLTVPANRKTGFSLLYLSHNLGFAVGPLLAGYLYESHVKWLFLGDAGTTLLSLVFLLLFLPETLPATNRKSSTVEGTAPSISSAGAGIQTDPRSPAVAPEGAETGGRESRQDERALKLLLRQPVLLGFVFILIVPWFVYSQQGFALPMFAKELFPETGARLYGKAMSLNALTVVFLTVPLIQFTRRFRPITNVAVHSILYALGFGLLAFLHSPLAFYLSVLVWSSGEILGATNIEVFTANHTPASHRGRFTSILPLISGTGIAIAPWLTGIFLENRATVSVWSLCLVLGTAAALGFLVLGLVDRRRFSGEPQTGEVGD